jgi:hypothetical protein
MRVQRALLILLAVGLIPIPTAVAHHGDTPEIAEFAAPGPVTLYHHYLQMEQELKDYQAKYPDKMKFSEIGTSTLGLKIFGVEITNFKEEGAVPIAERKRLYFDGSIHSNEQLGMEQVMDIMRWLLDDYSRDPDAKEAVDTRYTYIIPLVNPDGNIKDSRQNANNIDLNRNFPHGWGGPGSAARGPSPASEVETKVIMKFLAKAHPHYLNSFHTGTLMLLHPFGNHNRDEKVVSPDHDLFTAICQQIQADMNKAAGKTVPCGQVYSTIYPASGATVDYAYVEFGTVSWTMEVDNEQNLWVHNDVTGGGTLRERLGESWVAVHHAYKNVHRYGAVLELVDVTTKVRDGEITSVEAKITNTGMGAPNNTVVSIVDASGKAGAPIAVNPPIIPGETRVVRLPATLAVKQGEQVQLKVAYNRTFYKGELANELIPLDVIKQGANVVLRKAGSGAGAAGQAADTAADSSTPGFDMMLLAVASVGAVVVFRRRN